MPLFLDFHDNLSLPAEAIDQITADTRDRRADEFGVRQVALYHNADGKVYCLLEAPDEDAVRKHHAAVGVDCGAVDPVTGVSGRLLTSRQRPASHAAGGTTGRTTRSGLIR
jgi:hypothetical protein